MHLDLDKIHAHQRSFVKARDWDQFHSPKNLAMALAGEAGELVEVFQWLKESESFDVMKDEKKATAVKHELSDILNYTIRIADVLGVDLSKALWEKYELNEKRYPADKARGHATKYTDL